MPNVEVVVAGGVVPVEAGVVAKVEAGVAAAFSFVAKELVVGLKVNCIAELNGLEVVPIVAGVDWVVVGFSVA